MSFLASDRRPSLTGDKPLGLKIVIPEHHDVANYGEQGMIYNICQDYDLQEVSIGAVSETKYFKSSDTKALF